MQVSHRPSARRPLCPKKSPYIAKRVEANSITLDDVLSDIVFII